MEKLALMQGILIEHFDVSAEEATKIAEKIISFINNKGTTWISTVDSLPEIQDLYDHSNTYYLVKVENFGERRAMFLRDENGAVGWYSSYIDKIIRLVTHYRPEFKL